MSDLDKEELRATKNMQSSVESAEMNEEEIIKYLENVIKTIKESDMLFDEPANIRCGLKMEGAIQGLLDLYNKEKEKNKELLENATVTYFNDEELKESVGNYLGVLLKKNIEKDYISKNKIREIIYPTPTNPISYEIQTSDMYRKILQLLEEK